MYSFSSQEIRSGGKLVIFNSKIVKDEPAELFAQIVHVCQFGETSVAIPDIVPFVLSNEKPIGKSISICQFSGDPPEKVGVVVTSSPTSRL